MISVSICVVVFYLFRLDIVICVFVFSLVIYLCKVEIMILWLMMIIVGRVSYRLVCFFISKISVIVIISLFVIGLRKVLNGVFWLRCWVR